MPRTRRSSRSAHTDALVVRIHGYAESSAVVVLLTSRYGCVHAMAKGAKRTKNSFRGPLDKCVLYRARLGRRGTERLSLLHSASVTEIFPALRADPTRFHAATLVLEVASDLLREDEPHEELFRLTVFSLKVLDRAPRARIGLALAFFLTRAVALSGHVPETDHCLICGAPVTEDRPLLSPERGGILHAACSQGEPGTRTIDKGALELMAGLRGLPAARALDLDPDPRAVRSLRRHLVDWLQHVLARRFRAAHPAESEISLTAPPRG